MDLHLISGQQGSNTRALSSYKRDTLTTQESHLELKKPMEYIPLIFLPDQAGWEHINPYNSVQPALALAILNTQEHAGA